MPARPVVGLSADFKLIEPHDYHCVGDKYVRAVIDAADALPVLLPALPDKLQPEEVIGMIDGLLLTGSYANVHPRHYDGGDPYEGSPLDTVRDELTLRLIPVALEHGVPLFGICRGFQEINVALGGSLHQKVHEEPGYGLHKEDDDQPLEVLYGPAHAIHLEEGGILAGLSDSNEQTVNSVHGQGIAELAAGLVVEAHADDGLIEAFRIADAESFALAVQWHPEWKPLENTFYTATWRAFGDACRQRAATRK